MKIIRTDNFGRETVSDRLVCDNIENEHEARIMLNGLRVECGANISNWYIIVNDDYKLYKFEP